MPQSPDATDPAADIPAGFVRRVSGGPYFRALGDVYWRQLDSGGAVIALRVAESPARFLRINALLEREAVWHQIVHGLESRPWW